MSNSNNISGKIDAKGDINLSQKIINIFNYKHTQNHDFELGYSKVKKEILSELLIKYSSKKIYNEIINKIFENEHLLKNAYTEYTHSKKIDKNALREIKYLIENDRVCFIDSKIKRIVLNIFKLSNKKFDSLDFSLLKDIEKLKNHSEIILKNITNDINGIIILRDDLLKELEQSCNENHMTLISGKEGVGKSAIVKMFIKNKDNFVFALRAEELSEPHIDNVLSNMSITSSMKDLSIELLSLPNKYLVIESLEKIFEDKHQSFLDLLSFTNKDNGWKIIVTVREYITDNPLFKELEFNKISVNDFNDSEFQSVLDKINIPRLIIQNTKLKEMLKKPFYLSLACKALSKNDTISLDINESELKDMLWNYIIRDEQNRKDGLPDKREKLFIDIAIKRIKSMRNCINYNFSNDEYIIKNKLEEDGLLLINKNEGIFLSHDIWEEWAIYKYFDKTYEESESNLEKFFENIEDYPLIHKFYKAWLIKD